MFKVPKIGLQDIGNILLDTWESKLSPGPTGPLYVQPKEEQENIRDTTAKIMLTQRLVGVDGVGRLPKWFHCHVQGEPGAESDVYVFLVTKNEGLTFFESAGIFPSDQLITQIRMVL